jgi:predicted HicB family RNase H-like nuclease
VKNKGTTVTAMGPAEYLKKPYGRFVIPESDGTFRAEIIEFPGCIAVGDTAAAALASLEHVAVSWLQSVIARKQPIPEPVGNNGYSGKLLVRLPKSLHKKAAQISAKDGVSLNQFIVSSIAEQVGYWFARQTTTQVSPNAQMVVTVYSQFGLSGPSPLAPQLMLGSPRSLTPIQEWQNAGG